jgi:hypothetical protein
MSGTNLPVDCLDNAASNLVVTRLKQWLPKIENQCGVNAEFTSKNKWSPFQTEPTLCFYVLFMK